MDRTDVAKMGTELALRLEELAQEFHVKSDRHEILGWEAVIVRAKAENLTEAQALPDHLEKSALLSPWGTRLAAELPDIARQVSDFHAHCDHCRNT